MKTLLLFWTVLIPAILGLSAGEPSPDKAADKTALVPSTWRPYKELPDVLFFEGFEHAGSAAERGKLSDENVPPGNHAWKLEATKDESLMELHLFQTPLRIPQGLNPNQISIQASIFSDEAGTVTLRCDLSKGEYAREAPVPRAKAWGVIQFKLADLRNKEAHPETVDVIKDLEIHVRPMRGKKEVPKVWVDDILITLNTNPAEVKPRVMAAEKRRLDMEKQLDRDGYAYTMAINDFLKSAIKTAKIRAKAKHALVIGPTPELTLAWTKQLAAAAAKLKDGTGYAFEAATDPIASDKPIGGLVDMRTLLLFNLQKEPEMVLCIGGADEAVGPGRPSEDFHVVIERALDAGTVPVVFLPSAVKAEQIEKIAQFDTTMSGLCAQWGAPLIAGSGVTKTKGELNAATPGTPAFERSVEKAMAAIKHIHDNLMAKE